MVLRFSQVDHVSVNAVEKFIGLFLSKTQIAFWVSLIIGIILLVVGLVLRFKLGAESVVEEKEGKKERAKKEKTSIDLSDREIQLLKYFYSHPREVLSRDRLLNAVWGIDYFGTTRTLDQHVAQLRKKIEQDPRRPKVITTVHGVGYRYESS